MEYTMEINIKNIQDVVSLELAGKLDVDGARELNKTIANLLESNKILIHLNLSRVSYINSLGLGILVSVFQEKSNQRSIYELVSIMTRKVNFPEANRESWH